MDQTSIGHCRHPQSGDVMLPSTWIYPDGMVVDMHDFNLETSDIPNYMDTL